MKIDYTALEKGLESLTGYDFEKAERETRLCGDGTPEIVYSKTFQAVIAAKVLNITQDDIKSLPIKDYVAVTSTVSNFLLNTLAEITQQKLQDK